MNNQNKLKISQIPPQVGCYLFQDRKKRVIYVGKAKNLRQRIVRHLQESQKYLGLIADWEIILTNNVKEALILEQNLIKKHQPLKNFNPNKKDLYFGPFPDGTKAAEILQILEKVFPLAKCKGNLGKPCLDYLLGQCSGHCFKKVEPEYYQNTKQKIIDFFQGKTQIVKKELQKTLQKSILNQEFELAKKEKKILDSLNFFVSKQNIEFPHHENYDFFGFYSENGLLVCFFLLYRYGKLSTTEAQIFQVQKGLNEKKELLQSYLYQFYQKNLSPQVLYLPEKLENQELLVEKFGSSKNDKTSLLEELGNYLQVDTPYFLEVLDISNLFQQDVVAGFLVYLNGEKVKSKSKIYQLTASEKKNGGKLQVKAVLAVRRELNLNFAVAGLAKNEKHQTEKIITSNFQELPLPTHEALKNFLVNLQVEVHHFVINFHRKLHRKSVLEY
ncbi:12247_t:CDS:2 [Entrophospora sp. SA101]|nr:12247_t:CDS:2 [Entrophospora sp. SA101]CAJ0869564.1 6948_t:CDS:2 [Entrophospora sp. SA101]